VGSNPAAPTWDTAIMTEKENTYARDHLANERTYLAWLRTSVNLMVLGLVVARLVTDHGSGRSELAGGVLVGAGFILLAYGTLRSRQLTDKLRREQFSHDRLGFLLMSGLVALSVAGAILLLSW
jgi:inner membrane protein YidH